MSSTVGSDSDLARVIAPVLKRLYPHNPDVVIGREARVIAAALIEAGWVLDGPDGEARS